jgi:transcriptional regulator with XRE-family HTH domain
VCYTHELVLSSHMDNPVARQIRAHMRAMGMNQTEFGKRAGIGKGGVSLLLSDTTNPKNMKAGNLRAAAKEIGISMEQLLTGQPGEADTVEVVGQFASQVLALQIVARSFAKGLHLNMPGVARDVAVAIMQDAEAGQGPFALDGLLFEVLGSLGQGHLAAARADATMPLAGSGGPPKR